MGKRGQPLADGFAVFFSTEVPMHVEHQDATSYLL